MSLKIKGWRKITKWAIWSVIGLLFLIFLIKVATFEANYYGEKEGSERAVATEDVVTPEDLIEEKPAEEEVREYKVAADRPRYLTIEALGIYNSRVLPMGVNTKGELDTPRNIFDVGWYEGSGKPGEGGTMIIDGHNGGPHVHGVFKELPSLVEGDIIKIERGDGAIFNYKVVSNIEVSLDEANKYMASAGRTPQIGKESITLITCTGEWSQSQGTYLSRQFTMGVITE